MAKPWEEIWNLVQQRRSYDNHLIRMMIDIRDRYNNEVNVYLPTVQDEPTVRSMMPQLIQDGIENLAMRASGQLPSVNYPVLTDNPLATKRASIRGRATYASWYENGLNLKLRRAFRHYAGYGTFAMVVMPNHLTQRASIELRDPLTCYPELRNNDDIRPPANAAFIYGRSREWIVSNYPQAREYLYGDMARNNRNQRETSQEVLWDTMEWIDEDEVVIGIMGPRQMNLSRDQGDEQTGSGMELSRIPNRAGIVPVAVPRRITMDRITSQMASIVPIVDWAAKLTALDVLAAERSVFPDMAVIGDGSQPPQLIGGRWYDGRTGKVNLLAHTRDIQVLNTPPSQITGQVIDRLEQAGRFSGGILPQFGGETGGSLRTGRALDTMGSFSIDPRVAEAQDVMARALEMTINPAILETEKGYWPTKKYTVFSGWAGDSQVVDYTPGKDFDNTMCAVQYAFPGTDVSQLSVALAQLNGAGLISRHTSRIKHPLIDNAENEEKKLAVEAIESAILGSIPQQIASGQMAVVDAQGILVELKKGLSIEDAIDAANKAAQARQAQQAPPPDAAAGQAGAPDAMAGLAGGAAGAGMQAPIGQMSGPAAQISTLRALDHGLQSPGLREAGHP